MGHQVGCYLSFAQVEQLDDLADAAGKCRSALLRDIIADFLKEPSTEIKDLHLSQLDGCDSVEDLQRRQFAAYREASARLGWDSTKGCLLGS